MYCEKGRDEEDENVKPVEFVEDVAPLEWGQGLLVVEGPRDIIVGNVDINGGSRALAL